MKRPAPPSTARAPHEVRIIGGQWRRTRLAVADLPGLRPTPDRVRETLFNWLGQDLTGWRCVDAFAGTGALGFEAASRGAAQVLLVEQEPRLVSQLRATADKLRAIGVEVKRANALTVLAGLAPGATDLIFLDPPFDAKLFDKALAAAAPALRAEGFIYLEAPAAWSDEALAPFGLAAWRHLKAGAVHAHLLRRAA
ncbi:16S rRNA (guanine(966)-N(2))-methyltransferase RsmD [Caenimonas aquaedulcis]|uniref:16S rRNA (Guanine(966)-N(2))-methyltransferase RsmD n=1 Tax=Caenimonas aquaedulcis TaxID=2793270 RepID=A0A931H6L1_9BURK|nr:16S rRNA (guanine(966)-N(2))-methyltransferase RsmD [Caenimonas aquaedulcis]MBG9389546.1 16S rRNA (guanine(966)-N(2))-methyltransferase RsmD [Caenimonas aquaedulcis]